MIGSHFFVLIIDVISTQAIFTVADIHVLCLINSWSKVSRGTTLHQSMKGQRFHCDFQLEWQFSFGLIFIPKKKNIDWIKKNQTAGSNWSVSIILEQKPKSNRLVSVWFDSVSVRFGYFILKTKNYIVFWVFFVISKGFGFGLARFFINFSLVWFFGFRLMKSNRSVF